MNPTASAHPYCVADLSPSLGAHFIRKTYTHLAGAIAALVGVEYVLLQTRLAEHLVRALSSTPIGWILFLCAFMAVGGLARWAARRAQSPLSQYTLLAAFTAIEALFLSPLNPHRLRPFAPAHTSHYRHTHRAPVFGAVSNRLLHQKGLFGATRLYPPRRVSRAWNLCEHQTFRIRSQSIPARSDHPPSRHRDSA